MTAGPLGAPPRCASVATPCERCERTRRTQFSAATRCRGARVSARPARAGDSRSAHSAPVPRAETASPTRSPRVPRGQRAKGLHPHILSPARGGPGPRTPNTLSLHGKALHNTVRTHPKHSAFPTPRRGLAPRPGWSAPPAWRVAESSAQSPRRSPAPAPTSHAQPLSPPLCPSPLLPKFWFELVTGSNHHIPQAAGANPGAGAGAIPPGRVWE